MVATFNIVFDNGGADGAPGANSVIDALGPPNIRFKQADNPTIDNNNPMPIPSGADNFSRWKQLYLKCTAPPSVQVDNIRFYSDGTAFGTGVLVNIGLQFPVKNSGASTGYQVADVNATMVGGHTDISTQASVVTYTVGSPLTGPSISEAGAIINATNETSNYIVLQMVVSNTASPGDIADRTLTFKYDEI